MPRNKIKPRVMKGPNNPMIFIPCHLKLVLRFPSRVVRVRVGRYLKSKSVSPPRPSFRYIIISRRYFRYHFTMVSSTLANAPLQEVRGICYIMHIYIRTYFNNFSVKETTFWFHI